jgi:antitoxin (DNA-binding transcriptional repressor) of toxin-antitoxin stability system
MSNNAMKTVSVREFYHHAGLVDGLSEGQQLVVTANGKPKFVVSKSQRPTMTRKLAEARAVGRVGASTFDGAAFLASLKK